MAGEFHVSFAPLIDLVSWSVFALGISNLVWMPLAMCIGKRPVIIISMLIFLGGTIWSFKARTVTSLLGSRILASFGAGSIESLGPSIIADIFMERYFATAMACFALFLSGGSQVGPVIAGYITADRGWRWFFKFCAIVNGFNIITCVLFLPETSFRRAYAYNGETAAEIDKEATEMVEHKVVEEGAVEPDSVQHASPFGGNYWKNLVSFSDRGQEKLGLKAFLFQFSLTFRFLLVPAAVYAAVSYGVILGG
jgi:MFS family permease